MQLSSPTNKQIFRLAVPNVLSNISVPLLGMVDTALMGHLDSPDYLGAIALGGILFNFLYWGFGFLRMGTTGMTAQAYGEGKQRESVLILSRALLVAVIGSTVALVLQYPIANLGFGLIEGEEQIKVLGREYFLIRIYAAPATISLYALHGWFLGMQNAKYPMILTIAVNLLNILFNCIFLFGFGMKADGVALGTVCAQYIGLGIGAFLFIRDYAPKLPRPKWPQVLHLSSLKHFFAVNSDIFIRTMCLVFTFAFFTSKSSGIDKHILAANEILLQYFFLMSYGVDGLAFAAESLAGKYMGQKDIAGMKKILRTLMTWGLGLGVVFALLYLIAGRPMLRVFTDQIEIIQTAREYILWLVPMSIIGAWAFMWDGIYIGVTATKQMRNSMLVSTFILFLPIFYLLFPYWGNHALWLAVCVFMLGRGVMLYLMWGAFLKNKT